MGTVHTALRKGDAFARLPSALRLRCWQMLRPYRTPCPPSSSFLRFALLAYGGEGLAQGIEDLLGADDVGQTVTVEIGPQG